MTRFSRTQALVGEEGWRKLQGATVAVFGLGGVGGYALEAVARAGIGRLILLDADKVEITNMNRQILALETTLGRPKVDVARERVLQINPGATVETYREFLKPGNLDRVFDTGIPYAIDAIDSLNSKVHLIAALHGRGACFVSCMGASSRRAPMGILTGDISETRDCPLAKRVRVRLRHLGISKGVLCVYSRETPPPPVEEFSEGDADDVEDRGRPRRVQPSISYVPGIIGLTAAGIIINAILAAAP